MTNLAKGQRINMDNGLTKVGIGLGENQMQALDRL